MRIIPINYKPPVSHFFIESDLGGSLVTHNAITDITPYEPEILFVGTYNPRTPGNHSDFFYHRNYFWPVMCNLFIQGYTTRTQRRKYTNPVLPPLNEILMVCNHTHMSFADLVKSTFHTNFYTDLTGNVATYKGETYNLIEDNALGRLDQLGLVEWSTEDIIDYLRRTPSIYCVRLTRQPTGVWKQQWNQIIETEYDRQISFGTIHTPSGQGLRERGVQQATALARRWLFHPDAKKRLCDQWLQNYGVPIENFNYPNPPLPLF